MDCICTPCPVFNLFIRIAETNKMAVYEGGEWASGCVWSLVGYLLGKMETFRYHFKTLEAV